MIIEVICDHGVVLIPAGIKFQHEKFTVKVELPETEIISSATQPEASNKPGIRQQIDNILGPYKDLVKSSNTLTAQDYKNMWHEHLDEKYVDRR